jgi:hypothetical protein
MSGGHIASFVMAAMLGNVSLVETITTLSTQFPEGGLRAHLLHSAKLVDQLREYRNYYIHYAANIERKDSGVGVRLELTSFVTKNSIKLYQEYIGYSNLEEMARQMAKASGYLGEVNRLVQEWIGHPEYRHPTPLVALLEKPPLPDRLTKPLAPPTIGPLPPEASSEIRTLPRPKKLSSAQKRTLREKSGSS